MDGFLNKIHGLPFVVKLLLCFPVIEIFYGVCRIINSVVKGGALSVIIAVITVFPGAFIMWIVDLVFVIWKKDAFMLGIN